jgi:predicted aminopeptidase
VTVRRAARVAAWVFGLLLALYGVAYAAFGDVRYITRAAIAEADILRRRRPIIDVVNDSATDAPTRGKLLLVVAARAYAEAALALAAGETFTTYTALPRDTLVLVLSAARSDTLAAYTWNYPVVGRMPYRGFFSLELALAEAAKLQRAGLDTYLRPATAFSTLGWFNDPLLSTTLRTDSADLAATVVHEILHNTLFIKGHVDFNESFAEFVGYRGAEAFFRGRGDSANAARAALRWQDVRRLADFYDDLARRLDRIYASGAMAAEIRRARGEVFRDARDRMAGRLAADLKTIDGRRLAERPLNNAVLLSLRVYGSGLDRFDSLLAAQGGDLRRTIGVVRDRTANGGDPWEALKN